MTLAVTNPVTESVPQVSTVSQAIDKVRLRYIGLDLGAPDFAKGPPIYVVKWAEGYSDGEGNFVPVHRKQVEIVDLIEIGTINTTLTHNGEAIAPAMERISFEWLQSQGLVPAGSIEV